MSDWRTDLGEARIRIAELEAERDHYRDEAVRHCKEVARLREALERIEVYIRSGPDALTTEVAVWILSRIREALGDNVDGHDPREALAGGGQDYATTVRHESSNAPEALDGGGQ